MVLLREDLSIVRKIEVYRLLFNEIFGVFSLLIYLLDRVLEKYRRFVIIVILFFFFIYGMLLVRSISFLVLGVGLLLIFVLLFNND